MMRPPLSPAAAGLLRGLVARAAVERERILLTDFRSIDWQSLMFIGERHEIRLTILPPGAVAAVQRIADGLGEANWHIAGQIVADVVLATPPRVNPDGSVTLVLEALTIAE